MFNRTLRSLTSLAISLCLFPAVTLAGQSANPAPASANGLLPVSTFARHATLRAPRLSPDGKHLLVVVDDHEGRKHALMVYQLSDMSVTSMLRMPVNELPVDPIWVDNEWIALSIGKKFGSLDTPSNTGQVIATSIDGRQQRYLYGYHNEGGGLSAHNRGSDQGFGFIVGRPETPNGHIYLRAQPWGREKTSILYDINVARNARHLLAHMSVSGMNFLVDPDGKATYAFGTNSDFKYVAYRNTGNRWFPVDFDKYGDYFEPIAYAPDHQHIYAILNKDGGPGVLYEMKLDGSQRKLLASDNFASIGGIQWTASPSSRPFAVFPAAGTPHPIFIDPNLPDAKLYRALQKAFPTEVVNFINFDQDGGKLLFYVSSDRDPGTYYLLNTHTHKVRKLFAAAPWIKPGQMATRWPFKFKASDGMELEGILTFPLHRKQQNLPMVLIPHGGPFGVKDSWFFDRDAQFLANRGYLVLQVNYRGSSGRGLKFKKAGYRKWGTRIQQDLIDGVKWTIEHHFADPDRICVYGGSFGGYSALMSVIRAPHLFKCAIGYAGVYDLGMVYDNDDVKTSDYLGNYFSATLGKDKAKLEANSPDKLADEIDVPVFLAHGKDDSVAPFAQAKAMRDAFDAIHKSYEWMAVDGEGHGFYTEEHRAAFLTKMQAFLKKYIGPGAPVQPQK
ncbi:MAG TPA: prolyl oligopeptidase family serine peptidase [Rhodanobacteraceae bacterium]|nr:prolyl oligopeptidase family serine peptidase [Rhodanobacteraceae bacterium]